jgi:CRP-like cAMP-binding protein
MSSNDQSAKPEAASPGGAAVLARTPFFSDFDMQRLERVAALARWLEYPVSTQLYDLGEPADDFLVLTEGMVRLRLACRGRRADVGYVLGPGEVLGWAALLEAHQRRICAAESLTHVSVLAIDGGELRALMEADHTLGYHLARQLSLLITRNLTTFAAG